MAIIQTCENWSLTRLASKQLFEQNGSSLPKKSQILCNLQFNVILLYVILDSIVLLRGNQLSVILISFILMNITLYTTSLFFFKAFDQCPL